MSFVVPAVAHLDADRRLQRLRPHACGASRAATSSSRCCWWAASFPSRWCCCRWRRRWASSVSPTPPPGLVFVHVVYGLAFTTLFFRNFYVSVPDEMVKAARIDGAGFFTHLLAHHPAAVAAHHRRVRDLAVHADLERFPVRRRVLRRRAPADHGGAQQPGQHLDRREGIQRRHGGGHHRRPCRRCSSTSWPASTSCAV